MAEWGVPSRTKPLGGMGVLMTPEKLTPNCTTSTFVVGVEGKSSGCQN